jgi:hypothetical protein
VFCCFVSQIRIFPDRKSTASFAGNLLGAVMSFSSGTPLVVTRFLRKLHGGSQPILAEANDGLLYVVKFADNLQGANLCFNEAMGTELYKACGLPVANWMPIYVPDTFLAQNPECWTETQHSRKCPAAGLCFGSRYVTNKDRRIYEILSGQDFKRILQPKMFWMAWILDACANHTDNRQAIFERTAGNKLKTSFIDFGHMFGSASGTQQAKIRSSSYLDFRIYPTIAIGECLKLCQLVHNIDAQSLSRIVDLLPTEWKTASALRNFERCLLRTSSVQDVEDIVVQMTVEYRLASQRDESHFQSGEEPFKPLLRPGLCPLPQRRSAVA